MKKTKVQYLTLAALVMALAATGCRTKHPQGITYLPGSKMPQPTDISDAKPLGANPSSSSLMDPSLSELKGFPQPDITKLENYIADTDRFKDATVHFAYDSSTVKNAEEQKIVEVAAYLKANSMAALRVEGHCDERGTEEYNRSLGERRALAVREQLVRLGIDPEHILTATFGKDRPVDQDHSEGAWNKNRRGEFVLLTPPK